MPYASIRSSSCLASWRMLLMRGLYGLQAVDNLAVALLGQGKLKEGTQVLEADLQASPSTLAMAEPFLFNICACFSSLLSFYFFYLRTF